MINRRYGWFAPFLSHVAEVVKSKLCMSYGGEHNERLQPPRRKMMRTSRMNEGPEGVFLFSTRYFPLISISRLV